MYWIHNSCLKMMSLCYLAGCTSPEDMSSNSPQFVLRNGTNFVPDILFVFLQVNVGYLHKLYFSVCPINKNQKNLNLQQARVRSPVGTSFLGEVFSGFFLTCETNAKIPEYHLAIIIIHNHSWPEMLTRPKQPSNIYINLNLMIKLSIIHDLSPYHQTHCEWR